MFGFFSWLGRLLGSQAKGDAVASPPEVQFSAPQFSARTQGNLSGLNKRALSVLAAFVVEAQTAMVKHGVTVEVISGFRSWQRQAELYAQGRTKPGKIVTKAKPGSSWHNYGLAIDLGLFKDGQYLDSENPRLADKLYRELGDLAATMGIEWAGTWKSFTEGPHFQVTFGLTLANARTQMEHNGQNIQALKFPA
jgi:peptidoglycan L-alanyl-D-glutamate endopeptidase CwlK